MAATWLAFGAGEKEPGRAPPAIRPGGRPCGGVVPPWSLSVSCTPWSNSNDILVDQDHHAWRRCAGGGARAGPPLPVARTRADADGAIRLHVAYTVPYHARPGFVHLSVIGERSQRPAEQRLYVVPLQPWATASAYVVHPGDRVRFDVYGFAAREAVEV